MEPFHLIDRSESWTPLNALLFFIFFSQVNLTKLDYGAPLHKALERGSKDVFT